MAKRRSPGQRCEGVADSYPADADADADTSTTTMPHQRDTFTQDQAAHATANMQMGRRNYLSTSVQLRPPFHFSSTYAVLSFLSVSLVLLELPVLVLGQTNVCFASNCLLGSPTFERVFPDYFPKTIGSEYTVTIFRFFIGLTIFLFVLWFVRWMSEMRHVWALWRSVRAARVIRLPEVWAAARSSITRDVLVTWLTRDQPVIEPKAVARINVEAHIHMATAKLCVKPLAPTSPPNGAWATTYTGGSASAYPHSPLSPPPSTSGPEKNDYELRLMLSTAQHRACLVEVWLGVDMKTVVKLMAEYEKFRARSSTGRSRKSRGKNAPSSPADTSSPNGGRGLASPTSPLPEPFSGQPSSSSPPAAAAGGRTAARSTPVRPIPQHVVGPSPDPPAPAVPPRAGAGGANSPSSFRSRSSRVSPAPIQIQDRSSLPGTAPSPQTSPSHITVASESKHISQLSLREKERGSKSLLHQPDQDTGATSNPATRPTTAATSDATSSSTVMPSSSSSSYALAPPQSALTAPSSSSSSSPAPSASSKSSPSGPVRPLYTCASTTPPEMSSALFYPHEYMHALPPVLYAPGSKQHISIDLPGSLLRETLKRKHVCPILVFLSTIDAREAVPLGGGGASGGAHVWSEWQRRGGELTIVQFAPRQDRPAGGSSSPAPTAASSTSPPALALPATSLAAAAAEDAERKEDDEEEDEDEEKKDDDGQPPAAPEPSSPGGGATSPSSAALQDSLTVRAKFERQLILTGEERYEMEELYGLDTNDAECIICLTEVRDVVLLPCKHVCVCSKPCFNSITKCPICRSRITAHLKFIKPEDKTKKEEGGEDNEEKENA